MSVQGFVLAVCVWTLGGVAAMVAPDTIDCPWDYCLSEGVGGCLKFHPIPETWEEAVMRCHSEGAVIASPVDEEMNDALSTIVALYGQAPIFTGISNIYSRKVYQTLEGIPLSDVCLTWPSGAHVNFKQETCITISANGTADAVACSDPHPFVCYKQKGSYTLNECGTTNPAYVLNERTGSCYKLDLQHKLTCTQAFESCAKDGAHLAVINSEAEAQELFELSKNTKGYVMIGLRATTKDRVWLTVQGQSLADAGYAKWHTNEPNNYDGIEFCGSIILSAQLSNGILNDVPCDLYNWNYMCEIEKKKDY